MYQRRWHGPIQEPVRVIQLRHQALHDLFLPHMPDLFEKGRHLFHSGHFPDEENYERVLTHYEFLYFGYTILWSLEKDEELDPPSLLCIHELMYTFPEYTNNTYTKQEWANRVWAAMVENGFVKAEHIARTVWEALDRQYPDRNPSGFWNDRGCKCRDCRTGVRQPASTEWNIRMNLSTRDDL